MRKKQNDTTKKRIRIINNPNLENMFEPRKLVIQLTFIFNISTQVCSVNRMLNHNGNSFFDKHWANVLPIMDIQFRNEPWQNIGERWMADHC